MQQEFRGLSKEVISAHPNLKAAGDRLLPNPIALPGKHPFNFIFWGSEPFPRPRRAVIHAGPARGAAEAGAAARSCAGAEAPRAAGPRSCCHLQAAPRWCDHSWAERQPERCWCGFWGWGGVCGGKVPGKGVWGTGAPSPGSTHLKPAARQPKAPPLINPLTLMTRRGGSPLLLES